MLEADVQRRNLEPVSTRAPARERLKAPWVLPSPRVPFQPAPRASAIGRARAIIAKTLQLPPASHRYNPHTRAGSIAPHGVHLRTGPRRFEPRPATQARERHP